MTTAAVDEHTIHMLLGLMAKPNALALDIALHTGLRISDVLSITREQAAKGRFTVREHKTGKSRRITLPRALQRAAVANAGGGYYVFGHRLNPNKHRTRSAVSKDLARVRRILADAGYLPKYQTTAISPSADKLTIGTHSMRKSYARRLEEQGADVATIKRVLNHDYELTTILYCMAAQVDLVRSARQKRPQKHDYGRANGPFGCGDIVYNGETLLDVLKREMPDKFR